MIYGSIDVINHWLESNTQESPLTIARILSALKQPAMKDLDQASSN
jgi:hypothetical protein